MVSEKNLSDMKKVIYPSIPFFIGGYKFTKVKSALDFVKLIENFHFGEKNFHINSAWDKVSKYCASVGVHFEYSDHFDNDEQVYQNACSMSALQKGSIRISQPWEEKAVAVARLNISYKRKKLSRRRRRNP